MRDVFKRTNPGKSSLVHLSCTASKKQLTPASSEQLKLESPGASNFFFFFSSNTKERAHEKLVLLKTMCLVVTPFVLVVRHDPRVQSAGPRRALLLRGGGGGEKRSGTIRLWASSVLGAVKMQRVVHDDRAPCGCSARRVRFSRNGQSDRRTC